jgi:hypothetical protein
MRLDLLSRILFIIYCLEAGAVFLVVPWGAAWDRTIVQIPFEGLRYMLLHPVFRSLISAFGVVHLVWAVNDVDLFLQHGRARRKRRTQLDNL